MTFGSQLRNARKAKQLTQKELAARINAKHNSISNWENDQNMPDPDTIQNLCWVLDVQPNYFFSMGDSRPMVTGMQLVNSDVSLSQDEAELLRKFRRLDARGQAAVLNVLEHEYASLPGDNAAPAPKKA